MPKTKINCPVCSVVKIYPTTKMCHGCTNAEFAKLPIGRFRDKGNGRLSRVRDNAQYVYYAANPDAKCQICGYNKRSGNSKLLDICHIHDLQYFDDSTPIGIVNNLSNLLCMCPTHHREFDAGIVDDQTLLSLGVPQEVIDGKKKSPIRICEKCGKTVSDNASRCVKCYITPTKIDWPSDEELGKMVMAEPLTSLSLKLGVSRYKNSKTL